MLEALQCSDLFVAAGLHGCVLDNVVVGSKACHRPIALWGIHKLTPEDNSILAFTTKTTFRQCSSFPSGTIHIPLSVSSDSPLDRTLDNVGLETQQKVKDRSIG